MDPLACARNPCQIMDDGKHAAVVQKSFFSHDRQGPRRMCSDAQARCTESDDLVPCDIFKDTFGSMNVLSKTLWGLCGDQLMPVAETGYFVAGFRNCANDRRVLLSQPSEGKKSGLRCVVSQQLEDSLGVCLYPALER